MRRWNLPQVNTKVMCAVLTAAMVMTGFTAWPLDFSINSIVPHVSDFTSISIRVS